MKKTRSGFQKKPLFVVVGKNVSKKAAERNIVKRRIKAILQKSKNKNGGDMTVIAQKAAAKASFKELENSIKEKV